MLVFSTAIFLINREDGSLLATVNIGNTSYAMEIADDIAERKLGLGGRSELEEGSGMIFTFEREGFHSFWMEGMEFSLDIVWIDEDSKIIDIERNVSPDDYPQQYVSIFPAKYVLEVNAGEMLKHGVQIGDTVNINGL